MAAIHSRRVFAFAGLLGLLGLVTAWILPTSDSIIGLWWSNDANYRLAFLRFEGDGQFGSLQEGLLLIPQIGTWREVPRDRLFVADFDGSFAPKKTRYYLESDSARPVNAAPLDFPIDSTAFLIHVDEEQFLILKQKGQFRIHGLKRNFRRYTWIDRTKYLARQWWHRIIDGLTAST